MIDKTNIKIQNKLTKKIIYVLDLDLGVWLNFEYDTRGNDIYYENYRGDWVKKEYDNEGKRIYYDYGHIGNR